MIFNELNTGFRWYDALSKQTRFKEYCQTMCDFTLMAPCNDLLPFQIKTDSMGQPTEWLLKYLDGTQLVPDITPAVDPAPISWGPMSLTAPTNGDLQLVYGGQTYGNANFNTSMDQTFADLVTSVNTATQNGALLNPGIPFITSSVGFIASYDSGTDTFTLNAPVGSGATYNVSMFLAVDGGTWTFPGGVQSKTFSGGVDAITNYVESDTIDITDCIEHLNQYELDGFNYLQYNGNSIQNCLPVQMECGKWYSEISDGVDTVYSEVFEVTPITDIAFEQMKLPLFVGLRFYDSISKQNRYKEYCENLCSFYLLSRNTALPPFQIKAPDGTLGVESWVLVGIDEDCEYLLDTSLIEIVTTSDGDRITYNGESLDLPCGKFYMILSDGITTWYSELIELTDAIPEPSETFYILQEDGDKILQETGFGILQE